MPVPKLSNKISGNPVAKTRASKGRSRSGCLRCKERRVKCDELRPCSRCKIGPHVCVYSIVSAPSWNSQVTTFRSSIAAVSKADCQDNAARSSAQPKKTSSILSHSSLSHGYQISQVIADDAPVFDTHDVFLLAHFKSTTSISLIGSQSIWVEDVLQLALQHDFVMHAILGLSARHLQETHRYAQSPSFYNYGLLEAHHLKNALSSFNKQFQSSISANQDAALAASFLLCFHACSTVHMDPLTTPFQDSSLAFLRGIRSIVASHHRAAHSGVFKSLVAPPRLTRRSIPRIVPSTGPFAHFINLLNGLPPIPHFLENREVYEECVESLAPFLSLAEEQDDTRTEALELLLCFLEWQAFCPAKFVALVNTHDPIALILLAYFYATAGSVLSEAKSRWWWWQSKPSYMVQAIDEYLGSAWTVWMDWPRAAVQKL
ncbi:hypothetical protein B0J14DRAFT_607392 [Halenospora varia]|uniref:Zn(2)-C6 fungal-type domain-containing protein n=1 Tax=Zopfia rhizophila CBS 207.26 TaxID=1314779 RepID=A0A6A6E8Q9_9PEZI|nr:hypothetical protein K469DRAFT_749192 [Zopfia rhizophila CBS 207.26]KAH6664634.1 hypothetical protein B0J14DRAFT_607392 [Halenospora varia]